MVVGALLGAVLSTWLAPKIIAWYFTPPAQIGLTCVEPIQWALGKLQVAQAVGLILGAAAGIFAYFSLFKRKKTPTAV
jgi:hypothetical protein